MSSVLVWVFRSLVGYECADIGFFYINAKNYNFQIRIEIDKDKDYTEV